jgi:RimJ/RimL family protein N-acetyltransferase
MSKLERMGLIASEDSYVGLDPDDRGADGWEHMFVTQRAFWQIDPRIFLFTLSPAHNSPFPSSSPFPSRPSSPNRDGGASTPKATAEDLASHGLWSPTTPGPFYSASHLPTYYPPLPQQYKLTDGIRHPVRPKPPRQGETFYTRYIPSLGQYLSFRTPSLSAKGVVHSGPIGSATPSFLPPNSSLNSAAHSAAMANLQQTPSDTELLHKWMNDERVNAAWGEGGPIEKQENFLRENLQNRHSFPVIGCWDGKPFGYFEIYWVKEDILGKVAGGIDEWDRGLHVLVGENEYRGSDRVRVWMSALVHFCFLADSRTQHVLAEPRVDNKK